MEGIQFEGTTEECYRHFVVLGFKSPAPLDAAEKFVGADRNTMKNKWLRKFAPLGDNLLRLRFFLDALGYQVRELRSMGGHARSIARIYAYREITIEELAAELDHSVDHVRRILMGQRELAPEREAAADAIVDKHFKAMAARQATLARLGLMAPPEPGTAAARLEFTATPDASDDGIIVSFAHCVQGLIPLSQMLASDRFTANDRKRARELSGGTGVFDLSNLLNALCGERAFEAFRDERN